MRCDYIAEGVINAAKELSLTVPLIVRLKGTKEAEAKEYVYSVMRLVVCVDARFIRMIRQSGLKIIPFDDLDEAAQNAVKLAV